MRLNWEISCGPMTKKPCNGICSKVDSGKVKTLSTLKTFHVSQSISVCVCVSVSLGVRTPGLDVCNICQIQSFQGICLNKSDFYDFVLIR